MLAARTLVTCLSPAWFGWLRWGQDGESAPSKRLKAPLEHMCEAGVTFSQITHVKNLAPTPMRSALLAGRASVSKAGGKRAGHDNNGRRCSCISRAQSLLALSRHGETACVHRSSADPYNSLPSRDPSLERGLGDQTPPLAGRIGSSGRSVKFGSQGSARVKTLTSDSNIEALAISRAADCARAPRW